MTLAQKRIYMYRLLGFNIKCQDKLQNVDQKRIIDRQIISYLSTESFIHKKPSNKQHLSLVSEKIQSAINLLQNPLNCFNARILVCPVWPFLPLNEYLKPGQSDRILIFRFRQEMRIRAFDFAPLEIKNLLKYHSNPTLWFHGQLIKYIWRENERTKNATNQIVSKIPFECGVSLLITKKLIDCRNVVVNTRLPLFGSQVRCLEWVDFWFNVMEEKNNQSVPVSLNCTNRRMLFIASDVLKDVVKEAKGKWEDKYEIYHGTFNIQSISFIKIRVSFPNILKQT
uniref:FUT8_N_cat domain-containing protein n=1 Tax=Meloidogyne hapla TaxID=6305 RepID=A0A1I8AZ10_MELHA